MDALNEDCSTPRPRAHERRSRPRLSVMVVDDDALIREAVKLRLEERGDRVTCCAQARQALELLRAAAAPDLIVLDLVMPEMDGWQFRAEQKRDASIAAIPVIVMSGDHSAKAAAVDAAAYVRKPLDDGGLLEAVELVAMRLDETRNIARRRELARLVSLGGFVGRIAHEFNQPLATLFASLEHLQRLVLEPRRGGDDNTLAPEIVQRALLALDRGRAGTETIAALVQSASRLAFSGSEPEQRIDVQELLDECIDAVVSSLRHDVRVVRSYGAPQHVHGARSALGQAFENLLSNAARAVLDSGAREPVIRVTASARGQQCVVIISDNAWRAVSETTCLFHPLAGLSAGAGRPCLELAISRELVQALGGDIEVDGSHAYGATFRVVLPTQVGMQ